MVEHIIGHGGHVVVVSKIFNHHILIVNALADVKL
jgi:hypothetical protein